MASIFDIFKRKKATNESVLTTGSPTAQPLADGGLNNGSTTVPVATNKDNPKSSLPKASKGKKKNAEEDIEKLNENPNKSHLKTIYEPLVITKLEELLSNIEKISGKIKGKTEIPQLEKQKTEKQKELDALRSKVIKMYSKNSNKDPETLCKRILSIKRILGCLESECSPEELKKYNPRTQKATALSKKITSSMTKTLKNELKKPDATKQLKNKLDEKWAAALKYAQNLDDSPEHEEKEKNSIQDVLFDFINELKYLDYGVFYYSDDSCEEKLNKIVETQNMLTEILKNAGENTRFLITPRPKNLQDIKATLLYQSNSKLPVAEEV